MNYQMPEISYQPIGIVHSPFKTPEGTPIQPAAARDAEAVIEIFPEYEAGLQDLNGFSHIFVLFHMHLVKGRPLRVIPFLDTESHGVFATRSPARPNPIGLSVVVLEKVVGNKLYVRNIHMLEGSAVLDIKPYITVMDAFETSRNGWFEKNIHKMELQKDDGRFTIESNEQ
jgi:tRNA-Thr(GGU) m(6)t(6)A37 methyltransferase TsaA